MQRFSSARSKLGKTAYNIFGWIHAVSTKQTTLNSRKLSSRCFAGTGMLQSATYTYRTFQLVEATIKLTGRGNQLFGKADGSHDVGHYKISLLRNQSNSFR